MTNPNNLWWTKLAARIHDPAEKALVLLRDPAGHEGGTSYALTRLLGQAGVAGESDALLDDDDAKLARTFFKKGLPMRIYRQVQRGDWWAAAADRPQFPMTELDITNSKGEPVTIAVAEGARVNWSKKPVLIHPLTGMQFNCAAKSASGQLDDIDLNDLKERSQKHLVALMDKVLQSTDSDKASTEQSQRLLLAFWRFGSELTEEQDNGKLGELWGVLPADTRIPDHSIWDHLDLTSAFAGAFAADPNHEAALLTLSLGPVQGFIAAARSTSDLWAGSHLLSRLAWEAMRVLCEELGPDAVLFPRLRGIAQVDLWLRDAMGLPAELFANCEWQKGSTDANPLFAAALPNRLVALVPASKAQALAEKMQQSVRNWLQNLGKTVVDELLDAAGVAKDDTLPCYQQMREQLQGFPEVHWAAVPFSLIGIANKQKQTGLNTTALQQAMAPFFGSAPDVASGFLASTAWQVLQQDLAWDDKTKFFAPNPGVLYPAVYDLAERIHAAAKATRAFAQNPQSGWRCALTGEVEWLTTDKAQLKKSYRQQTDTLWCKVHQKHKSWAKKGEHLGGLAAIKRLWPVLFADEVGKALDKPNLGRFVVSTHTMALAKQLQQLDQVFGKKHEPGSKKPEYLQKVRELLKDEDYAPALPRKLAHLRDSTAARIPAAFERLSQEEGHDAEQSQESLKSAVLGLLDDARVETYYSMILMDGDKMGAILSGDESNAISYLESFHPAVKKGFEKHAANNPAIKKYGDTKRAITPNRHLAISGALNDFSQTVVRHVVEGEYLGRVIYAGGDDVLAMLPVADMLPAMQRLQQAYQGHDNRHEGGTHQGLTLRDGFAAIKQGGRLRLMRMMGTRATASCGAIVAHHQAPLASVLSELRSAEKRTKTEGGRDAFSITIVKRSGGALYLTAKWGEPIALLQDCMDFLRADGTSRRAVYNTLEWLHDLPPLVKKEGEAVKPDEDAKAMLDALLAFQLKRQTQVRGEKDKTSELAYRLASWAQNHELKVCEDEQKAKQGSAEKDNPKEQKRGRYRKSPGLLALENFLSVAEFLARETRSDNVASGDAA